MTDLIIIEPSDLIYEGLVKIITDSAMHIKCKRADNLAGAKQWIFENTNHVIIINPSIIQYNIKDFNLIKHSWENVKWIALIYTPFDRQTLDLFDQSIHIFDNNDLIIKTIGNTLKKNTHIKVKISEKLLSERETDVLEQLTKGLSNKEIAEKLHISINTVITHRKNIAQKTGIKSVSGLTIYAVVNKLIAIENTTR